MTREREIDILMKDRCTKKEAVDALKRGTTIFEDFEERFDNYMKEWEVEDEELEQFRDMVEKKDPLADWSIVELEGHTYYIAYAN